VLVKRTSSAPPSSQIANSDDQLPGLHSESANAQRYRDLVDAFLIDVGGIERCSEIKLALIRRLAAVTVQSELLESRVLNGFGHADTAALCALASTTVRLAQRIGIERVGKLIEPPPTLDGYLARANGKRDDANDADDAEIAQ
jgi:hypothetical protein